MPYMEALPEDESSFRYIRLQNRGVVGPRGLPLLKPPYSTIAAFDMNRGEILWQAANGDGMASVENNRALDGVDLPPLGGGGDIRSWLRPHCSTMVRIWAMARSLWREIKPQVKKSLQSIYRVIPRVLL